MPEVRYPTDEWAQWAQDFDAIRGSIMDLGTRRQLHRAHRRVLYQHEDMEHREIKDGTVIVHHWMQDNYADSMLIGLRRVVDKAGGSFSLVKLLEQLERKRPLITLERYVQLWSEEGASLDDSFLEVLFCRFSSDGRTLDRDKIRADIDTLLSEHDLLLKYINSAIAHRASKSYNDPFAEPRPNLTWEDLDRLFDDITGLFNKYYALAKPGVHMDFESVLPAGYEQAFNRMVKSDSTMPLQGGTVSDLKQIQKPSAASEGALVAQLSELNVRSRWYSSQLWQVPFAYLGVSILVMSSVTKFQPAHRWMAFAAGLGLGILVLLHMKGLKDGVRRAVQNIVSLERQLNLEPTAQERLREYMGPLEGAVALTVLASLAGLAWSLT